MDTGSTAWILTSVALVLLMTPALAFFYCGLARERQVINTIKTAGILFAVKHLVGLRAHHQADEVGIDLVEHREQAYLRDAIAVPAGPGNAIAVPVGPGDARDSLALGVDEWL